MLQKSLKQIFNKTLSNFFPAYAVVEKVQYPTIANPPKRMWPSHIFVKHQAYRLPCLTRYHSLDPQRLNGCFSTSPYAGKEWVEICKFFPINFK